MPLRCLLVEDQLMLQESLAQVLAMQEGLAMVGAVGTAAAAIKAITELRPDLLILDFSLPDADGYLVARSFSVLNPAGKVILLSSYASTLERPADLRHSITAIIDKQRAFQDLLKAIEPLLPPQPPIAKLDLSCLTAREMEVFQCIGRGLTSQAIASELSIAPRTVSTHRQNLCAKLGLSGAALIHQATLLQRQFKLGQTTGFNLAGAMAAARR